MLSWSEQGKTRLRSLPAGERARFRRWTENYRRFRQARAALVKLHGAQGYHAFPRVLRSGGLIDALGPELGGRKTSHPETRDVTLSCPGFNRKNDYDRQTPCDQDPQADLLATPRWTGCTPGSTARSRARCAP